MSILMLSPSVESFFIFRQTWFGPCWTWVRLEGGFVQSPWIFISRFFYFLHIIKSCLWESHRYFCECSWNNKGLWRISNSHRTHTVKAELLLIFFLILDFKVPDFVHTFPLEVCLITLLNGILMGNLGPTTLKPVNWNTNHSLLGKLEVWLLKFKCLSICLSSNSLQLSV